MSQEKFLEASIASPPRGMTLQFVISRPSHPIEGIFEMQRTHTMYLGEMQRTWPVDQLK